jgi:hypothetical protein
MTITSGSSYHFSVLIMSLVRLLRMSNEFSWSQKEEIGMAIIETTRHYQNMRDECNRLSGENRPSEKQEISK